MAFFKTITKTRKGDKPNLPRQLFWDWDFEKIDWKKGYLSIIARVIERGDKDERNELIRYYGEPKVIKALKSEIKYLPDFVIEDVCSYFKLKKEDLALLRTKAVEAGTLDLIRKFMSDARFNDFNLVGGTALALKIGHRLSIDIDLFSAGPFSAINLGQHLTTTYNATKVRTLSNGVFCFVDGV